MGQDLSKSIVPPPLSLQDCLTNGQIDSVRYITYRRRLDKIHDFTHNCYDIKRKRCSSLEKFSPSRKRTRTVKRHKLLVRDNGGNIREILPTDTLWYLLYVANPPRDKRLHKLFRLRFRMQYNSFLSLSYDIEHHDSFIKFSSKDCCGQGNTNIKLLILGALRYIGRGWTFDDISEANAISDDTNRVFLYSFIEYGSTILYKKWVLDQNITTRVAERESLFRSAGFNGCIGSSDATHVGMLACPQWAQTEHKGFKMNFPSRTYNVTVDHTRKVMATTCGHPASWNDKTVVMFDPLLTKLKDGYIPDNFEFVLLEYDKDGNIVEVIYSGVWIMVDNGYLSWSCTVPPVKDGLTYEIIRFSEWLESMRKDAECFFGILKGRFRILRYGMRFQKISLCDKLFLTCCSLHNLLLVKDGLDKNWETDRIDKEIQQTPFAIQKLNRSIRVQNEKRFNRRRNCADHISDQCKKYTIQNKRVVHKMPLSLFQLCLVNHFDIRFKQKTIVWPQRIDKPNA